MEVSFPECSTVSYISISHAVMMDSLDEQQETVRLDLGQTIPAGHELTVRLDFRGTITDELNGLYRADYTGPDGVKQEFLVTQMEPCHARKVRTDVISQKPD